MNTNKLQDTRRRTEQFVDQAIAASLAADDAEAQAHFLADTLFFGLAIFDSLINLDERRTKSNAVDEVLDRRIDPGLVAVLHTWLAPRSCVEETARRLAAQGFEVAGFARFTAACSAATWIIERAERDAEVVDLAGTFLDETAAQLLVSA